MGGLSFDDGISDGPGISQLFGLSGGNGITDEGGSSLTPISIFGDTLHFWGNSENVTLNGSDVSQVTNLVPGKGSAVQATSLQQPAFVSNAINGYGVIRHNTSVKNLAATQAGITGNIYSAMVINVVSYSEAFGRALSYTNGAGRDFDSADAAIAVLTDGSTNKLFAWYNSPTTGLGTSYSTITAGSSYFTLECLFDDTNNTVTHWVNGVSVYSAAWTGTLGSNTIRIGGDALLALALNMGWPELIVNIGTPSTDQRQAMRNYLQNKYRHY